MVAGELDRLADEVFGAAGCSANETVGTVHLARKILGRQAVRVVPRAQMQTTRGALMRFGDDEWRIFLRDDTPHNEVSHAVGHELAHWALRFTPHTEEVADALGAALVAPRHAFRKAVSLLGFNPPRLARAFCATETAMVLRHGEVHQECVAVRRPGLTYVRGPWAPKPEEIDALITRRRNVTVIKITDAPGRDAVILSA